MSGNRGGDVTDTELTEFIKALLQELIISYFTELTRPNTVIKLIIDHDKNDDQLLTSMTEIILR